MVLTATYVQYEIVVNVYIIGALCVFGIAGNAISIVVLGRDRTIRRTTAFLLQMLAVADASCLVSCLFFQTLKTVVQFTGWLPAAAQRYWPYFKAYPLPIASMTGTAAVWMVVVLTADRYIAICRPLHAAQYSTMPRLRRAVAAVWVLAIVVCVPRFFELEVVEVQAGDASPSDGLAFNGSDALHANDSTTANISTKLTPANPTRNSTPSDDGLALVLRNTAIGKNHVYVVLYTMCITSVVGFILPLAAVAFFNHRLVRAVHESARLRRRSATDGGGGGGGAERQHTWMLIVVVVVFVACYLPSVILRVYWLLITYADVPYTEILQYYASAACNFMIVVNSSVNVVIYCFMGRQFRAIVLGSIVCRGGRRQRPIPGGPAASCTDSTSV